ncbi:GlxA family transcriptional regulator [Actomonas aquatica]|uniref:GlxA family transcriptional regulator n=1 Tax=Actomonas aquatica TaxID=2866162 RepID=A0ABZ1CDL7_9BACT|nr:GlxA family transcriptional regulator [Opitutus sp. WL0086]WRQ89507.1 GlxA family transcriptional regulator [Opitutus sp. WL0086]
MEIGLFVFPGFQLLDLSGPLAAFEIAQRFHGAAVYHPRVVSLDGGLMPSSSGVELNSEKIGRKKFDTLLVVGGDEMSAPCGCRRTRNSLRGAAEKARRVASICTGAYLLAETGLLDGRRVTTHWRFAPELLRKHPTLRVETDRIYVRDGRFWSSAGITAGIDLSLALIGDDFGEEVARKVAQDLVVFHRRPGGQSQYSALLELDAKSDRIGMVMTYARENLTADLSVEALAERAHLSPRQFARVFAEETGRTPAKAVEQLRVEAARVRVEENLSESLEEIAMAVGFTDPERMRRAFIRVFGQPPQGLRRTARQQRGEEE